MAAAVLEPADKVLNKLPLIGHSWWGRSLIPLAFCLTMLAAVGLDAVIRHSERRQVARWALGAFGSIAVVLGLVWLFARGNLPPFAEHDRAVSFVWPVVSTAVGLAAFTVLLVIDRRSIGERWNGRRIHRLTIGIAGSLLVCQTAFLVVDDGPIPSSSPQMYPPTPAVTTLQRAVGSSLVGLGNKTRVAGGLDLGLFPNTNLPYGIDEFAEYDPIAPLTYFTVWPAINKTSPGLQGVYTFSPGIPSSTVARRYGIHYVLEPHGRPGPSGSVFDTQVGNEDLYRIPGAAEATLVPAASSGAWPSTDAPGKAVPVEWPGPSEVRVNTDASSPQVLRLRVASFPGWHATIDGRPLALTPYLSMMLQAHIPPGKHVIELRYLPKRFTEGIVIAACAVLGFVVAVLVARRRRIMASVSRETPG